MGRVNVIYDNRHSEDYYRLLHEFNEQGIDDFKFWDAVVLKDSVVDSIAASHKAIVRQAKQDGLAEVCIAEQDVYFTCSTAWHYFMNNKPKEFDLYLACTYTPPITNNIVCGFHLYIIHEKFYDKFLSVPKNNHIDTAMDMLKGDYKFCYPFPALQRVGYSANNKEICNYNILLQPEDIYKG